MRGNSYTAGDSKKKLERLLKVFGDVCKRRKLTVNVNKSKVMKIGKNEGNEMNISLNARRMEEVTSYRYLGVDVSNDSRMSEDSTRPLPR